MAATSSLCFTPLPSSLSRSSFTSRPKPLSIIQNQNLKTRSNRGVCSALHRSNSYESEYKRSKIVDEDMIVLRKRIHEMKMIERNYEPPAHWNEWEKQVYTSYDEYICKALGMVQSTLMNTRPSVALGMLALMTMSVPTSAVLLALQVVETADKIASATGHM